MLFMMTPFGERRLECQNQANSPPGLTIIEAVQYTLLYHPALLSRQAQVQIEQGARLFASSAFDGVLGTSLNQSTTAVAEGTALNGSGSPSVTSDKFTQTVYSATYSELFRNGISIAPTYQATRNISPYLGPAGLNSSIVGLSLTLPLMRGRGHSAVAAQEDAAKAEVSASLFDLDQEIAQLVFNTASSYWKLLAAERLLEVAQDAEKRGKSYVDNTQALLDADRVPRNDLHEVTANLAQLTSQRVSAESAVVAARLQLAFDMGSTANGVVADLEPASDFPNSTIQIPPRSSTEALQVYIRQALQRRADYLAATRRTQEEMILLVGARNRLLPQLDVGLGAGYSQAQAGTNVSQLFSVPSSPVLGPNLSGSITLSLPFKNRAAKGIVLQSSGTTTQTELNAQMVARDIAQSIGLAVEGVRAASARVELATEAVSQFQTSLAGARQKYAQGFGSIVEILTIEDRLTLALNNQIQAQSDYAQALVQLRFATGTLVESGRRIQHISADIFVTMPYLESAASPK